MKLKLLLGAVLAIAVLWYLNQKLNEKPRQYLSGGPAATSTTPSGEVRNEFTVGFLPVT